MRSALWTLLTALPVGWLSLVVAAPACAVEVEVHLLDTMKSDAPPAASSLLELTEGGEARTAAVEVGGVEATLRIVGRRQDEDRLSVAVHVFGERSGTSVGWISRNLVIDRRTPGRIEVPGTHGRFVYQLRPAGSAESEPPPLNVVVRMTEAGRAVEERELELAHGPATVYLGERGREPLKLHITPGRRDLDGAQLDLQCDGRLLSTVAGDEGVFRSILRGGVFRLSWGDVLRVTGLEGPRGPVVLDLVLRP